jgi:predicted AAA+ superfamily ATPase
VLDEERAQRCGHRRDHAQIALNQGVVQLQAARADPEGFLAGDEPLTIDEVQRAPELLVAVKRAIDKDRRPGRFLLSGSANLSLLKGVSESLAGRAVYLTLRPFSLRELRGLTEEPAFLPRFFAEPRLHRATATQLRAEEVLAGGLPPSRCDRFATAHCGSADSYRPTSNGT